MALTDNLLAYYKLDEASGARADSTGSFGLTDNNTVGSATGILSNGANFVAANSEYFSNSLNPATEIGTGDFSISLWFKTSTSANRRTMISFDTNGTWTTYFNIRAGKTTDGNDVRVNFEDGGASSALLSATGYLDNTLHHVVMTRVGTATELYVDGVSVDTDTNSHNDMALPANMHIGVFKGGADVDYMDGLLDEVGIWTRELTATEVSDLYNSGSGLSYDDFGGGGTPTPSFIPKVTMF